MILFNKINEIKAYLSSLRVSGQKTGLVPTMGALHHAHLSIITRAKQENSLCVCSIFVNPIQFNNKEDLAHYPRTLESDIKLLESVGCDILFAPSEDEIYPVPDTTLYDLGGLDKTMEGRFRPGHFNGVAIIVKKLIDIVLPDKIYFGEKDFQQLSIMKYFIDRNKIPVEVIPCEIMRDPDGLAMSSRNLRLTAEERQVAPLIFKTLQKAEEMSRYTNPTQLKNWVETEINNCPSMKLEYFDIVDNKTLEPVGNFNEPEKCIGCIAVYLGNVRLIDNIKFV